MRWTWSKVCPLNPLQQPCYTATVAKCISSQTAFNYHRLAFFQLLPFSWPSPSSPFIVLWHPMSNLDLLNIFYPIKTLVLVFDYISFDSHYISSLVFFMLCDVIVISAKKTNKLCGEEATKMAQLWLSRDILVSLFFSALVFTSNDCATSQARKLHSSWGEFKERCHQISNISTFLAISTLGVTLLETFFLLPKLNDPDDTEKKIYVSQIRVVKSTYLGGFLIPPLHRNEGRSFPINLRQTHCFSTVTCDSSFD